MWNLVCYSTWICCCWGWVPQDSQFGLEEWLIRTLYCMKGMCGNLKTRKFHRCLLAVVESHCHLCLLKVARFECIYCRSTWGWCLTCCKYSLRSILCGRKLCMRYMGCFSDVVASAYCTSHTYHFLRAPCLQNGYTEKKEKMIREELELRNKEKRKSGTTY